MHSQVFRAERMTNFSKSQQKSCVHCCGLTFLFGTFDAYPDKPDAGKAGRDEYASRYAFESVVGMSGLRVAGLSSSQAAKENS
jgi:hypothetical protein